MPPPCHRRPRTNTHRHAPMPLNRPNASPSRMDIRPSRLPRGWRVAHRNRVPGQGSEFGPNCLFNAQFSRSDWMWCRMTGRGARTYLLRDGANPIRRCGEAAPSNQALERTLGKRNPKKVLNYFPRHAFTVFFWCAIFSAVACLGSIVSFLWLMPDNEHGRQGIFTAFRAFSPGLLVAVLIAGASYRVLRSMRRAYC